MEKFLLFSLGLAILIGVIGFTADFLARMYYSAIHTPNIKNIRILKKLILHLYTHKNKNHDFKAPATLSEETNEVRMKDIQDYMRKNNYARRVLVNWLNERGFSFGVYGTQHWLLEVNKYDSSIVGSSVVENIEFSILNEYSIDREDSEEKVHVVEVKSIIFSMLVRHYISENDDLITIIESIETVKGGNILFNSKK